jgi:hypothetical protein
MRVQMNVVMRASALLLTVSTTAVAQLANASAAAGALGGNYTAIGGNFNATAWNPATLGLPGNSRFSIAILPFNGSVGLGPVTLADVKSQEGSVIPDAVKRAWMQQISSEGSQSLQNDVGVTWAALNVGRIGLQASTSAYARGSISPATMEVLLFGNAGFNNGVPKQYALSGSTIDASVLTTIGLSYAQSLSLKLGPLPAQSFALGATAKYIIGNGLVTGVESGGVLNDNPLEVRINFPIVVSDTNSAVGGSGMGLDVGAAWKGGAFRAGAVIRNLVSSFSWDESKFSYRPVVAVFTVDSQEVSMDGQPFSAAPASLRSRVGELTLDPILALGVAYSGFGPLMVTAEMRQQLGDGLQLGAKSHVGLGAELRIVPFLPIRAGVASVTGGTRIGGGVGLEFGFLNIQANAAMAKLESGDEGTLGLTLSFGGR